MDLCAVLGERAGILWAGSRCSVVAAAAACPSCGDAHVLAEIVRKDREHHRVVAGDSELAEVVKTVARTHQTMIWTRQRQANQLRSMLREFYPAALEAFGD